MMNTATTTDAMTASMAMMIPAVAPADSLSDDTGGGGLVVGTRVRILRPANPASANLATLSCQGMKSNYACTYLNVNFS